jgi:hypothetical protein
MSRRRSCLISLPFVPFLLVAAGAPSVHAQAPHTPVDVCKLMTTAEAGEVLGTTIDVATPDTPQGSLLGGCKYLSMRGILTVSARPAGEFDATLRSMRNATPVEAGAGVKAHYSDRLGLIVSQGAKPYFLHIVIAGTPGPNTSERFLSAAKKIIAKG